MLLASSVSGLFKWRQFEPEVILLAVGWYLRLSLSGTSRSCSPSEVCTPITSRCGVGSSGTPQKWNDVCALDSDRPTTVGEWTKPTSVSENRCWEIQLTVRRTNVALLPRRTVSRMGLYGVHQGALFRPRIFLHSTKSESIDEGRLQGPWGLLMVFAGHGVAHSQRKSPALSWKSISANRCWEVQLGLSGLLISINCVKQIYTLRSQNS